MMLLASSNRPNDGDASDAGLPIVHGVPIPGNQLRLGLLMECTPGVRGRSYRHTAEKRQREQMLRISVPLSASHLGRQ